MLTDLVRRPLLRQSDLDLERNVILEEINGVEDTPDDLVFELHARALWPEHPYGYSILGTAETVGALSAADLRRLHDGAYFPATASSPRRVMSTTSSCSRCWSGRAGSRATRPAGARRR